MLPLHMFESSFVWPAGVKISTSPVGVGGGLEFTDASVGLPSQQPRGVSPLSPPPFVPSGGVRTNIVQLRKQNAKVIFSSLRTY